MPAKDALDTAESETALPSLEREPRVAPDKIPAGYAKVRILPLGHLKVCTGETAKSLSPNKDIFDGSGDLAVKFHKGDTAAFPLRIAQAQEANGHVEIVE